MHIFNAIYTTLEAILTHGGYWIIFVALFFEATPLLGSFVPGHALVILAGFLSNLGILNIQAVLIVSVLGAILGDIVGYKLGKKFGYSVLTRFGKYFFLHEEHLQKTRAILDKHTGKALILGRFNPITRALMPFLAGASGLHIKKFWLFNIIGGICWTFVSIGIGYLFGASYELVSQYIGKFIFIATILSILIVWAFYFVNSRKHIFAKYHLYTLITNIAALYIFFKTIQDALSNESFLAELDVWVNLKMAANATTEITHLMYAISSIISPITLSLLSLVLFGYLAIRKRWHHVVLVGISLGGGLLLNALIKIFVERVRPGNAFEILPDYSFPSGHATLSIIFFTLVMYLCSTEIKNKYLKELFGTINIFIFLLVGLSRIYLNVHWLSDVVAGFALGIFWLTFSMLFVKFLHAVLFENKSEEVLQVW